MRDVPENGEGALIGVERPPIFLLRRERIADFQPERALINFSGLNLRVGAQSAKIIIQRGLLVAVERVKRAEIHQRRSLRLDIADFPGDAQRVVQETPRFLPLSQVQIRRAEIHQRSAFVAPQAQFPLNRQYAVKIVERAQMLSHAAANHADFIQHPPFKKAAARFLIQRVRGEIGGQRLRKAPDVSECRANRGVRVRFADVRTGENVELGGLLKFFERRPKFGVVVELHADLHQSVRLIGHVAAVDRKRIVGRSIREIRIRRRPWLPRRVGKAADGDVNRRFGLLNGGNRQQRMFRAGRLRRKRERDGQRRAGGERLPGGDAGRLKAGIHRKIADDGRLQRDGLRGKVRQCDALRHGRANFSLAEIDHVRRGGHAVKFRVNRRAAHGNFNGGFPRRNAFENRAFAARRFRRKAHGQHARFAGREHEIFRKIGQRKIGHVRRVGGRIADGQSACGERHRVVRRAVGQAQPEFGGIADFNCVKFHRAGTGEQTVA